MMTSTSRSWGLRREYSLIAGLAVVLSAGCSADKEPPPPPAAQVIKHEKPKAPDSNVVWVNHEPNWPDTLRWSLDDKDEVYEDDLMFRLRLHPTQNFLGGLDADEHPLWTQAELTVRPIPEWPLLRGLRFDSVVYFDPVRSIKLPKLLMLSSRRHYDNWAVRTSFSSNAVVHFSPELTEGQLLEPTAYFTWDERTVIIQARPSVVKFLTEMESAPGELPVWNPDSLPERDIP